jgi:lipoate-protein ligase B
MPSPPMLTERQHSAKPRFLTVPIPRSEPLELEVLDLGRAPFGPVLRLQRRLVQAVQSAGQERACAILVEHDPPAITLGRDGRMEHILVPIQRLTEAGVELHLTERGGDVTYHGPGQLVCYPILRVDLHGRDLRRYVRDLEEVVIRLLGRWGISALRRDGAPGVWVDRAKIAAVGVAVRRWVSCHGLALNVADDLSGFDLIVPCGLPADRVTSMSRVLKGPLAVEEVKAPLVECLAEVFGLRLAEAPSSGGAELAGGVGAAGEMIHGL